jgi:hypothetical protein
MLCYAMLCYASQGNFQSFESKLQVTVINGSKEFSQLASSIFLRTNKSTLSHNTNNKSNERLKYTND